MDTLGGGLACCSAYAACWAAVQAAKPFARHTMDESAEEKLKERERWGDPMAHLVKKKDAYEPADLTLAYNSAALKKSGARGCLPHPVGDGVALACTGAAACGRAASAIHPSLGRQVVIAPFARQGSMSGLPMLAVGWKCDLWRQLRSLD
jgi:hypothetical protein